MIEANRTLRLRPGDLVEVRSAAEILSTLDVAGALEGIPFMPEMLSYCGRRFRVDTRAERACDPSGPSFMCRVKDTVHLATVRCDGSAHGGCQAGCLIFWKEAWLRRADSSGSADSASVPPSPGNIQSGGGARDRAWLETTTCSNEPGGNETRYRCQATDLKKASQPLPRWEPGQYVRDVWQNDVPVVSVIRTFAIMAYTVLVRVVTGRDFPEVRGALRQTPSENLGLQPGDWVTVKSKQEILATLDTTGRNRGLTFEATMLPYCGKRYQVLRRVDRIIDEATGQMRTMREPSIILDGVVCTSLYRRACSRFNYLFWREIWLRRADPPSDP